MNKDLAQKINNVIAIAELEYAAAQLRLMSETIGRIDGTLQEVIEVLKIRDERDDVTVLLGEPSES